MDKLINYITTIGVIVYLVGLILVLLGHQIYMYALVIGTMLTTVDMLYNLYKYIRN